MNTHKIIAVLLSSFLAIAPFSEAQAGSVVVDSVVASVNGKPITLSDLEKRLPKNKVLSLKEASEDSAAKQALESLINEALIQEEATAKRLSATDEEVDSYLEELAARNNMSRSDFEAALAREGRSITQLKDQARSDILRSKVAGDFIRGAIAVSDTEVAQFIKEHPPASAQKDGNKLQLSQILISASSHSQPEIDSKVAQIEAALNEGKPFEELAQIYSDSPEGKTGGSLGVLAEQDLAPQIFNAVLMLKDGEVSQPIQSAAGVQLFRLDKRFVAEEKAEIPDALKEQARAALKQRKTEERIYQYFTVELPKLYAVERKI